MQRKGLRFLTVLVTTLVLSLAWVVGSHAQLQPITTTNLCNSATTCTTAQLPTVIAAILRRPATDVLGKAHVGIVIMHDNSSYINFAACSTLAQRGFTTLCINGPFTGNQYGYYGPEQLAPSVGAGINYLRNNVTGPTVSKVVIFGHSGGGQLMPFYQNVAENGPSVCQGPEKLVPCIDTNIRNLPKADGVILFDAHPGVGFGDFTYTDPAVINNTLGQRDASVDMFDPANGYNIATNGATYTDAFKKRYTAAQAIRNQDLINQALDLLQQERVATGNPNALGDDIPFTIVGGSSARLWQPDLSLVSCTKNPHIFLSHDGTRPVQKVCSVRPPSGDRANGLTAASTLSFNVHVFLGARIIRTNGRYTQTADDITGIDWESSSMSSSVNIRGIGNHPNGTNATTPILIVANGGHYFLTSDEAIYDNATTPDKTYAIEEGSVHGGTECTACEALLGLPQPSGPGTFGYYGDTFTRTSDFMAEWLNARY
jgi:hypothetical protein